MRRHLEMARSLVFLSHETYTPARGGSAAAEVHALREVFGGDADKIVIANTKGFTGHPMAVAVLARRIELDGVVVRVLDRRDAEPAFAGGADEALDQRRLAAARRADDGCDAHGWTN